MIDLATITATLAHDRVAEQFAPRGPVRRAAVRALRTVADRPEPAPQT
jgi:hypothetical protein